MLSVRLGVGLARAATGRPARRRHHGPRDQNDARSRSGDPSARPAPDERGVRQDPFRWLFYRFLVRKLSDPKPSEYRFEQGSAWYRTPPGEEWLPLDSVPDPAAPIDELALGAIAIPAKRSGYTGEPMWNVIDVTELGCEVDERDLWAEWAVIKPSQIV